MKDSAYTIYHSCRVYCIRNIHTIYRKSTKNHIPTSYYFMFPAERTRDVQTLPDSKHLILYFIYDLCLKNVSNANKNK